MEMELFYIVQETFCFITIHLQMLILVWFYTSTKCRCFPLSKSSGLGCSPVLYETTCHSGEN